MRNNCKSFRSPPCSSSKPRAVPGPPPGRALARWGHSPAPWRSAWPREGVTHPEAWRLSGPAVTGFSWSIPSPEGGGPQFPSDACTGWMDIHIRTHPCDHCPAPRRLSHASSTATSPRNKHSCYYRLSLQASSACPRYHQAPPSLGFSRQEHWSGLPFPSPMHESEVAQSCPTLHDPMDCGLPGSSIHGIFQARVLEWSATAFSVCLPLNYI